MQQIQHLFFQSDIRPLSLHQKCSGRTLHQLAHTRMDAHKDQHHNVFIACKVMLTP